jgi:flagellar biogenesis protein FliO
MDNVLDLTTPAPLSLTTLATNLLLCILLSSALAWFYTRYGKSLSNRAKFARTLPVLALTTVLIISVVKSSLALSLGLVGALSIVRFRTAIKEPEELLYLFMAITIGLGLGADQRLPTILAVVVILGYLFARTLLTPRPVKNNLYLNVLAQPADDLFSRINQLLLKHVRSADLRRLDRNRSTLQATYLIACDGDETLSALMDDLYAQIPDGEFSFVEQDNTLGG